MSLGRAIGVVREIHRHPVKSMGGERIAATDIALRFGVVGDRAWAIRDVTAGEIRGAKKIPGLMMLSARFLEPPHGDASPAVEIELGDGRPVRSDDPDVATRLSERLGRRVELCARRPAGDLAHYRRAKPITDPEAEMREAYELLPDEAVPALAASPIDLSSAAEFATPPGTYFDFFDLHLVSTRSLASLSERVPGARIEARRFRPNLVVELEAPQVGELAHAGASQEQSARVDGQAWPELAWAGRVLAIGEVRLELTMPMMRCGMTTHAQPGLAKEPRIMRALVRDCGLNLGAALTVLRPGRIELGDSIRIADA